MSSIRDRVDDLEIKFAKIDGKFSVVMGLLVGLYLPTVAALAVEIVKWMKG